MLTDLHVHLRPDGPDTPAERHFTAANAARYREVASSRGIEALGVSEHVYRFAQALEVWRHPFWVEQAGDDLDAYCAFVRDETDLLLGIEADHIPGREEAMAALLGARDFDYVLGSVHFLGDESVDMPGEWDVWDRTPDADRVWRRYFEAVASAARSGLFDILSHPDLVKVWGAGRPRPEGDPRRFYEPALHAIAEAGVAVEVSTAGLRKDAGEIYPARPFLEGCLEVGAPITLSSDAHASDDLGHRYPDALALLAELGVRDVAVFDRRRRRLEPLG